MIYLIKNNKENAFYMWEDTGAIRETPDGSCFNFFFSTETANIFMNVI